MSQVRIGVLVSGSGSNLQAIIDSIDSGSINGKIVLVISNKKDAYGLERARKNNIKNIFINQKDYKDIDEYNDAILNELIKQNVELVLLAGYVKILTKKIIEYYKNKIINIHPSLIPSFCGKGFYGIKVHESVINYGAKVSGATVHFVDEKADTGPIILQEALSVDDDDTAETLQKKVLEIEHKILPLAVKYYCEDRIKINGRKVITKEMFK